MRINFDMNKVVKFQPTIEDGCYTISMVFDNYEVCTYGYSNSKDFIKDYTRLMSKGVPYEEDK